MEAKNIGDVCVEISGFGESIRSQLGFIADALERKIDHEIDIDTGNADLVHELYPLMHLIRSIGEAAAEKSEKIWEDLVQLKQGNTTDAAQPTDMVEPVLVDANPSLNGDAGNSSLAV